MLLVKRSRTPNPYLTDFICESKDENVVAYSSLALVTGIWEEPIMFYAAVIRK